METIKNYLESMFMNMPDTAEVRKARTELWQMMEDKYTELIQNGKSENEAVGTVISEFGNLNEIAEELGIGNVVSEAEPDSRRHVSSEEVKAFFEDKYRSAMHIALGVMLCILSPVPIILLGDGGTGNVLTGIGIALLFVLAAAGVGLFIYAGIRMRSWSFMEEQPCSVDFAATEYVRTMRQNSRMSYAGLLITGIVLCICSVIPASVIGIMGLNSAFMDRLSGASVLMLVSIGVFLIILAADRESGYQRVLDLNAPGTVSAGYAGKEAGHVQYSRPVRIIMSVYWPTVTCVYLIWSFISMQWDITWLIWPVAAIASRLIRMIGEKENSADE